MQYLNDIILFVAVFFMTPAIVMMFALQDSSEVYEKLIGYRKRTKAERNMLWVNMALTLAGAWMVVGIIYITLEVFG